MERTNQWSAPSIDKLMLRSRWYNHQVAGLDLLFLSVDSCHSSSRCESQSLVLGVHLIANIATNLVEESVNRQLQKLNDLKLPSMRIITTCEYKPVKSTFRNSPEEAGREVVMLGK
jgi:hypothetical protein